MTLEQNLKTLFLFAVLVLAANYNSFAFYVQQMYQLPLPLMGDETEDQANAVPPGSSTEPSATFHKLLVGASTRLLLIGQVVTLGEDALITPAPLKEIAAIPPLPTPLCPSSPDSPADEAAHLHASASSSRAVDPTTGQGFAEQPQPTSEPSSTVDLNMALTPSNAAGQSPANTKVLMAGDSMMQGVAPHLKIFLRKEFGLESVDLSRQSTGLAYPGLFNWPQTLEDAFATGEYQAAVIFLGANDTWDMIQKGRALTFGGAAWKAAYGEHVSKILTSAKEHKVKVIWLGAPPMGREKMVDRIPILNSVFQDEIAKFPGLAKFVPTAPSLTPDGNSFAAYLELPEQGKVMIRAHDGVHFTPVGQRMLAKLTLQQFKRPAAQDTPVWDAL